MINLAQITQHKLQTQPYAWGAISNLFSPEDAAALADSFPRDHFKTIRSYGGDKDSDYEARSLIHLGAEAISYPEEMSQAWLDLAHDLLSSAYRQAMASLIGVDLTHAPLEVNISHYGPGALLGPHPDLRDKIVTHVLYFNRSWNVKNGGCLAILNSANSTDIVAEIAPIVGNSAVLVRSDNSWHTVSRVVDSCRESRRSLTATFYHLGSVSTMWPPNDTALLHPYEVTPRELDTRRPPKRWERWWQSLVSGIRRKWN